MLYSKPGVKILLSLVIGILVASDLSAQPIKKIVINSSQGLQTGRIYISDSLFRTFPERPLYTFNIGDKTFSSADISCTQTDTAYRQIYDNKITATTIIPVDNSKPWQYSIIFENTGNDTISVSNIVPFGTENTTACITGYGPWDLARAYLYRPGCRQLRVILPDNAWELGYSSYSAGDRSFCSLARRQVITGGQKKRYETILPPGAKVRYAVWSEAFTGEWQNGIRLMFRDRYLHDLDSFDNSLFGRDDLQWIKGSYIIILQMAWDREFYDRSTGRYTYAEELRRWNDQFGFVDVFGIWPTWPRLGLDQRNQWDMYDNLPGGLAQLKAFSRMSKIYNTRFFISYNPWDNSTRKEDQYRGMARLIAGTEADGVVLDTRGSSSLELQAAADSVRKGVVMYSEGMAVTKDMPGIIAGRVHDAIFLSPELNLNKLIKPDFSIFRVCAVGEDRIHREIAVAFFNGYGTELNLMRPGGRDENYQNDLGFLSATTLILRQNNDAFLDRDWTPLISTAVDNIYVNRWTTKEKTIYTILNMRPEGVNGKLFKVSPDPSRHFVSLWNHKNLAPLAENGSSYITAEAAGFSPSLTGTRKEGSVDCIAELPVLLKTTLTGDSLKISIPGKGKVILWKGNPSYTGKSFELSFRYDTAFNIKSLLGYFEGKIVIQFLADGRLRDESIVELKGGKPWLISTVERTAAEGTIPDDMVLIPKTSLSCTFTTNEDFIQYPDINRPVTVAADSFLIDKYPVTNAQFYDFIQSSGYRPNDTSNFLRHWVNGVYKQGQDRYPVVYVSYDDALAYARWAGKRLPTQSEWQIAAQGTDGRKWPWGNEFHGTWCNNAFDRPTPVDAFSKGASPFGVMDMVGNVWQMTNDLYYNGAYYFIMIRGGSYYKPDSSWWYIQGGPQQLDKTQIMLLVSPGFDRNSTVGFRCVKDVNGGRIKVRK
ncbi:MAG TPA: SUMF1/EgtB/PvdO family nonheme iron enzyme [Bacteroidales bacterium]|nr:SUMF1/EgtB/PvdO family nonheme iron enzyme [Bacteroidales bacterium]